VKERERERDREYTEGRKKSREKHNWELDICVYKMADLKTIWIFEVWESRQSIKKEILKNVFFIKVFQLLGFLNVFF